MAENEELPLSSHELSSYILLSIPVICSTATIAVLACGIGFLLSAVLKAMFLKKLGVDEYESLKRKRTWSQYIALREWNNLMNQVIEEQSPDDQYLVRRTRSGCAYGVYHFKKTEFLPELKELEYKS